MREVTMKMAVEGMTPDEVFARVSKFEDYPKHTDAVRHVEIESDAGDLSTSKWEINFRDGIMRWTEEDRLVRKERRIEFSALDGDLEEFTGQWVVENGADGTTLSFSACFDLGLSTLNEMVEPIADEALREAVERIVAGLTDGKATVVDGQPAAAA